MCVGGWLVNVISSLTSSLDPTILTVRLCGESLLCDCEDPFNSRLSSTGTRYGSVVECAFPVLPTAVVVV